jgi:hypothetical protein
MSDPGSMWRRLARAIAGLPLGLRIALFAGAVLHGVALTWGMPASDAWDNDGIAPRDILPGLAQTFTPGDYYTYPPLQLILLALVTLPVTLAAVVKAGSTSVPVVIHTILAPGYMTAFTLAARVACLLQSLGVTLAVALIAAEIAGKDDPRAPRVATGAALFAIAGMPFTYYSHTSNLDVPYLFWGALGVLQLVRAIARREPKRLRWMAVFAALAAGTKDQAYALFLYAVPLALALWAIADEWARTNAKTILREGAIGAAIGAGVLAVVDGAVFNPSGFRARLRFLSGPASQDFATYSKDFKGRLDNFTDIALELGRHHYPAAVIAIAVGLGFAVCVRHAKKKDRATFVAAFVPLAVVLSFTLGFNMVARRVEERFTLPHALFLSVYAGFAIESAWRGGGLGTAARVIGKLAVLAGIAASGWDAVRVDATLLLEPRYDTERWLEAHAAGATIEVHGLNVYLPRFPETAKVVRVDHSDPTKRSPLPGVEEVQAPLADIGARHPQFVVVSGCYVWRYLNRDISASTGRIYPTTQHRDANDADATTLFRGLFEGTIGYHLAHRSVIEPTKMFTPAMMHGSLNCPTFTFERNAP